MSASGRDREPHLGKCLEDKLRLKHSKTRMLRDTVPEGTQLLEKKGRADCATNKIVVAERERWDWETEEG